MFKKTGDIALGTLQIDMINFLSELSFEINKNKNDKNNILSRVELHSDTTIYKIINSIKIGFDFSLIKEQIVYYNFSKVYEEALILCFKKLYNNEIIVIKDILKEDKAA